MAKIFVCIFICFISGLTNADFLGIFNRNQNACVKGKLSCPSDQSQAAHVRIKLWDEDRGPNPDDVMAEGYSDEDGFFELCGSSSDPVGDIDPVFKVYHNCGDQNNPCKRKLRFEIPKEWIGKSYDLDEIDLGIQHPGEERKCIPARRR